MSSRKEQKEQLRAERIAKEEAARRDTSRRRRMQIGALAGGVAIIAVIVVVIAATSGGGGSSSSDSSSGPTFAKGSVPASAEVGVQTTSPPWQPDYDHMSDRIDAMGLPGFNETTFHVHSWLHVYVDGKKVTVPANIGIDQATQTISPLHTHDTTGIIHEEADQVYDFTLGQFMSVWGVKFADDQLGSLKPKGDEQLQVYFNGQKVSDPVNLIMPEHSNIVIGFGKPGSFPTEPKLDWPQGL
jgi:hypothetical protein